MEDYEVLGAQHEIDRLNSTLPAYQQLQVVTCGSGVYKDLIHENKTVCGREPERPGREVKEKLC